MSTVTLFVNGVPLLIEPIRDLLFVNGVPLLSDYMHENEDVECGYSLSFEIEHEDGVFDALWYDINYRQTALDRWADDGGAL